MERDELLSRYQETRNLSTELCRPLRPEDYRIQSMPDVSPPWWNLGHTTWFFAKNILEPFGLYRDEDARLEFVMNSYYESLGPRIRRDHRGLVTRPSNEEVYEFRESVDARVGGAAPDGLPDDLERLRFLVVTGVHHEQQHQELLVTEVKHILGSNIPSLREPYRPAAAATERRRSPGPLDLLRRRPSGVRQRRGRLVLGQRDAGPQGLARRLRPGEPAGHQRRVPGVHGSRRLPQSPSLALERLGQGHGAGLGCSVLLGERTATDWQVWTLSGARAVDPDEPVCHVSFYEADAFARWKGARLPTEREWEHAARASGFPGKGSNFLDTGALHPRPAHANGTGDGGLLQMGGDLWEWTTNHYEPYPGYRPFEGTLMEYNGKFMDNVRVLRGGSCATPENHIRASYRNFWAGDTRFQFTGIRLAQTGGLTVD